MSVRILVGDVRERLADIPDGSVHCCVTSPPYYGLRDYKIPPSVWGGDADCPHEWDEEVVPTEVGKGNWAQGTNGRGEEQPGGVSAKREPLRASATRGFCVRCGAWRGTLGLEPTLALYVEHVVEVFRHVRRVLRGDGTLWLNIGDSYAGSHPKGANATPRSEQGNGRGAFRVGGPAQDHYFANDTGRPVPPGLKPKDLMMVPARVALALQADGWWLRKEIIWAKPNPMPESCADRPTSSHEKIYLLSKAPRYYYDAYAIREPNSSPEQLAHNQRYAKPYGAYDSRAGESGQPGNVNNVGIHSRPGAAGRNKRDVWTVSTAPFPGAHFATFPPKLVEPMILAGTSEKGCCPACGAPWVRVVERTAMEIRRTDWGEQAGNRTAASGTMTKPPTSETVGWSPSCACPAADSVPCTVLDPFGGAGTVGLVADRLGRDAVLIDLNAEYAEMARRRITGDAPMLARAEVA